MQRVLSRAVAVYMYLKNRTDKDKSCFLSTATIAEALSLSCRTGCRALNDLEQAGFIRCEARWRTKGEPLQQFLLCPRIP